VTSLGYRLILSLTTGPTSPQMQSATPILETNDRNGEGNRSHQSAVGSRLPNNMCGAFVGPWLDFIIHGAMSQPRLQGTKPQGVRGV
jgi:hypothetical protein